MGSTAARVLVLGAGVVAGLAAPTLASAAPEDPTPPSHANGGRSDQHAPTTTTGGSSTTATTPTTATTTTTGGAGGGGRPSHTDEGTHPAGNNGTVKVDEIPFDDHPDNEPHVGCTFQIDFYNYDEGDLQATITFELHDPTDDGQLSVSGSPLVLDIGEDPNGGGTDLDASGTYTLSFTGDPHPQQGHHVRLTVNAEGSQGADVKHKVFWVEGCGGVGGTTTTTLGATTTTTTGSTTTTTAGGGTTTTTAGGATTTTTAGTGGTTTTTAGTGGTTTTLGGATTSTLAEAVLGIQETRSPSEVRGVTAERALPAQAGPAALARTGAGLAGLAALGAGLVAAGQAARRRAR